MGEILEASSRTLELTKRRREQNRSFFHMDVVQKMKIVHPGGSAPQRGWSAVGAENSSTLYRKGLLKARMTEDLKDARVHYHALEPL